MDQIVVGKDKQDPLHTWNVFLSDTAEIILGELYVGEMDVV
jgi:hypothetical protein